MSTGTFVSAILVTLGGVLVASPANAVTYRCDGNLVTDSPTAGTNCVAMGSRMRSPTFSAGSVDATIEAEPTGAGRPATQDPAATPQRRAQGTAAATRDATRQR